MAAGFVVGASGVLAAILGDVVFIAGSATLLVVSSGMAIASAVDASKASGETDFSKVLTPEFVEQVETKYFPSHEDLVAHRGWTP